MGVLVAVVLAFAVVAAIIGLMNRAARKRGYTLGPNTIVRCSKGHLFTTMWIPGGSIKAVRLGFTRFQHCPVGHHWTRVRPVRVSDLTDEERAIAAQNRDVRVP